MEMTARLAHLDTKVDGKNCDGLVNHNGETTEIRVPLSPIGKRLSPIEGGNLYRLRDRKFLLEDKKRLCAWALGTAMLGILLMVLHAEMCPVVYQPVSRSTDISEIQKTVRLRQLVNLMDGALVLSFKMIFNKEKHHPDLGKEAKDHLPK